MSLAGIDVNLLVALDVLLEERHVTRAARRMGITQSAMSQTLQRVRELLDDPLLIRRGTVMVPSPRAEALTGPLRKALRALETTVYAVDAFEPASARTTFRVALFDVYALSLVPKLVARLSSEAPGVRLEVVPIDMGRVVEQQRNGDVDVALLVPREFPSDIDHQPLIPETMVAMARTGHPILAHGRPPDLEDVVQWPHLTVRITGRGHTAVDEQLAARGSARRVRAQVAYFLAAPAVVCASDLIAAVPLTAAVAFAQRWPVALFPYPAGPLPYTVSMTWARHLDADPAQVWLRGCIRAAAREVIDERDQGWAVPS